MSKQITIVNFHDGRLHSFNTLSKAEKYMNKLEKKGVEYTTSIQFFALPTVVNNYDSDSSSLEYDSDCSTSSSGLEYPDDSEDEETDSDSEDEETDSEDEETDSEDEETDSEDEDDGRVYTRKELKNKKEFKKEEIKDIRSDRGLKISGTKDELIDCIMKDQWKSRHKKTLKKAVKKKRK